MEIKELAGIIRKYGVAGAGGAGFPSYAKLDKRADTIILNCAECEPLLKVHRQLLGKYAHEIMEMLTILGEAVGAERILVAVKESYRQTLEAVRAYLEFFPGIELKILPEVYPMGDEVILIYETTGRRVLPGSIPIEVGVTVFNVETVYNMYQAVHNGKPVTEKYLTLAGEVRRPVTVKVPIGMAVGDVIELAGGVRTEEPVYIMGGPMTGEIVSAYDTVKKTTNAILVMQKNQPLIQRKLSSPYIDMKRAMSVCCQCEMCTDLCPRHELGQPITPHLFMRAATSGTTQELAPFLDTMFCCGCGVCELYACPQNLAPRKLISEYKNGLRKHGIGVPKGIPLKEVSSLREYRKLPMDRLTAHLGLKEYDIPAPLTEKEIKADRVKIALSQSIGIKARAVVKKGDLIEQGEQIGEALEEKLSLPIHASISGEVLEVNEDYVIIRTNAGNSVREEVQV